MAEMSKKDLAWIIFILVLVVAVLVISSIFYFKVLVGGSGTTGHVVFVFNKSENNSNPSPIAKESRIVDYIQNPKASIKHSEK